MSNNPLRPTRIPDLLEEAGKAFKQGGNPLSLEWLMAHSVTPDEEDHFRNCLMLGCYTIVPILRALENVIADKAQLFRTKK